MYYQLSTILFLFATVTTPQIGNDYVQFGFLGILLTILIWYAKRAFTADGKREQAWEEEKKELLKTFKEEKKEILDRCESLRKEMAEHHERAVEAERERYNDLNLELMVILKANLKTTLK